MNKAIIFRDTVIRPVLAKLGLGGQAAEEFILGAAVQESLNFKYRTQVGGGPAKGYFQMEPSTHDNKITRDEFIRHEKSYSSS